MNDSDRFAIESVLRGDRERFSDIVDNHKRMVHAIAWSYLGDADLCEDAAQETFLKAFKYLGTLKDLGKFPAWLSRIARNVSAGLLRRRKSEIEKHQRWQLEQPTSVEQPAIDDESENTKEMLGRKLAELSPQHRESLVLFYLEEKSIAEAAELLDISESAMKTRLHRARNVLRESLEKEIEVGLRGLAPKKDFTASVMVLLPGAPLGVVAAGGGASVFTKFAGWIVKLLPAAGFIVWMALSQVTFFYFFMRWFAKLEISNIIDRPENEFRKAILRKNVLTVTLCVFLVMIYASLAPAAIGLARYFQILSVFCVWGLYKALRVLRVNSSQFIKGQALTMGVFLATSVLIGFFGAPWVTFMLGIFVLNIVLAKTNRKMPRRQDYNLFLRGANESLGFPSDEGVIRQPATEAELRAFARFLGEHWLVRDYSIRGTTILLRLPPVRTSLRNSLLMSTVGDSFIRIEDGLSCRAYLSKPDAEDILKVTGKSVDKGLLERKVSQVVESTFAHFLQGRVDEAVAILSTVDDSEVFLSDPNKSKVHKRQATISIAAAALGLVLFSLMPGAWRWGALQLPNRWNPVLVSRLAAKEAVEQWVQGEDRRSRPNLLDLWSGPVHPSMELMGEEDAEEYKETVSEALKMNFDDGVEGAIGARIVNAIMRPHLLYHTIATPILTDEELATLGFEAERIHTTLSGWHPRIPVNLYSLDERSFTIAKHLGIPSTRTFKVMDIESLALRLHVFKHFDCLGLVDTETLSEDIAGYQVSEGFQLPEGFASVDLARADGLFHFGRCGLRETWSALIALDTLGKIDDIDREACVEGILRFYKGKAVFKANESWDSGLRISGKEDDAYCAMESLVLLDAWDRIEDWRKWEFHSVTQYVRKESGQAVTGSSLRSWAYQERLEKHRGD